MFEHSLTPLPLFAVHRLTHYPFPCIQMVAISPRHTCYAVKGNVRVIDRVTNTRALLKLEPAGTRIKDMSLLHGDPLSHLACVTEGGELLVFCLSSEEG